MKDLVGSEESKNLILENKNEGRVYNYYNNYGYMLFMKDKLTMTSTAKKFEYMNRSSICPNLQNLVSSMLNSINNFKNERYHNIDSIIAQNGTYQRFSKEIIEYILMEGKELNNIGNDKYKFIFNPKMNKVEDQFCSRNLISFNDKECNKENNLFVYLVTIFLDNYFFENFCNVIFSFYPNRFIDIFKTSHYLFEKIFKKNSDLIKIFKKSIIVPLLEKSNYSKQNENYINETSEDKGLELNEDNEECCNAKESLKFIFKEFEKSSNAYIKKVYNFLKREIYKKKNFINENKLISLNDDYEVINSLDQTDEPSNNSYNNSLINDEDYSNSSEDDSNTEEKLLIMIKQEENEQKEKNSNLRKYWEGIYQKAEYVGTNEAIINTLINQEMYSLEKRQKNIDLNQNIKKRKISLSLKKNIKKVIFDLTPEFYSYDQTKGINQLY